MTTTTATDDINWQEGDNVTDLDTGVTGTITDAGDGQDVDTMEIAWDEPAEVQA